VHPLIGAKSFLQEKIKSKITPNKVYMPNFIIVV